MSVYVNKINYCYGCPWATKEEEYRCNYYGLGIDKPLAIATKKRPEFCKVTEIITVESA